MLCSKPTVFRTNGYKSKSPSLRIQVIEDDTSEFAIRKIQERERERERESPERVDKTFESLER